MAASLGDGACYGRLRMQTQAQWPGAAISTLASSDLRYHRIRCVSTSTCCTHANPFFTRPPWFDCCSGPSENETQGITGRRAAYECIRAVAAPLAVTVLPGKGITTGAATAPAYTSCYCFTVTLLWVTQLRFVPLPPLNLLLFIQPPQPCATMLPPSPPLTHTPPHPTPPPAHACTHPP